jgi:hypothetical protein
MVRAMPETRHEVLLTLRDGYNLNGWTVYLSEEPPKENDVVDVTTPDGGTIRAKVTHVFSDGRIAAQELPPEE